MRNIKIFAILLLTLALIPLGVCGQTANTSTVLGTVTDPTGAIVVGAQVEFRNIATNEARTQTTNTSGQYVFPGLSPGNYKVTVTMRGFRTAVVSNLTVDVAKSHTLNFVLEVGTLSQIVEVSATAHVQLQTTDAQIGQNLTPEEATRYPSLRRNASGLLAVQPGVTVGTGVFPSVGVRVAGAIDDQNTFTLDGIDVTDNVIGGGANIDTVVPLRVESIEELRVGVTNPNATFGRASGGQVAVVGRRGTNALHGTAYWYHQNDELNANTWENNRAKIPRAELKDNRFGGKVGGPIWKDHTFFFFDYEGRRFPQVANILRFVPSDKLKQGILRFPDSTGKVVEYPLATSTACGTNGTVQCDARAIGLSPTIKALWALMPPGNDPSVGDGLNTLGFRGSASTPFQDDYWVMRLDHQITRKWRFNGSYTYYRILQTESIVGARGQLDIRNGQVKVVGQTPSWRDVAIGGVDGEITPHLLNSFRFGWVRQRSFFNRLSPAASAALLNLPGTSTQAGPIALAPGLARALTADLVDAPVDVDTQRARFQATLSKNIQVVDNLSWIKGTHTLQFGTNIRHLPTIHIRNDKVVGSLASLVALMDADVSTFLSSISPDDRPPQCSTTIVSSCLTSSGDALRWDRLYAATLGLVDNVGILTTRDGNLNPLPFGTPLINDSTLTAYEFYAQDTWRIKPTLTLTYGLSYGWQTPPSEALSRQTLVIDASTGSLLTGPGFIAAKGQAALQGKTFAPNYGFLPVRAAKRDIFDIDWGNVGPRLALAWNPSVKEGFFHRMIGEGKTVLRGGFSLVYDRTNTVQSVIIPMLGVGFAQTISVGTPNCNVSGAPGPGCVASSPNPGASIYRVGVDGTIPLPTVPAVSTPVVPGRRGELFSFQVDPDNKVGRSYSLDFTIQREVPGNMILELGWTGRWSRRLPQGVNLNSSPYFFKDPASGQTFAQAYDAVAQALINKQPVTTQQWFENQLPGFGALSTTAGGCGSAAITSTQCVATQFPTLFTRGLVSSLFNTMNNLRVDRLGGLPPFNSLQLFDLHLRTYIGTSNYQGLLVSLRKRTSHGLSLNANYTFSKTLDDNISDQNQAGIYSNSFVPSVDRGRSFFDRTHVFNAGFLYDLPFGKGHRLGASNWLNKAVGGWYVSGIVTAFSGLPLIAVESAQAWGGGTIFGFNVGAIPTVDPGSFGNGVNHGVAGSGGIGTAGDPSKNGTGLNLFANPQAVFNSFRNVQISKDGRTGRSNPIRGLPFKNLDLAIGKRTSIAERVTIAYSFDFFNILNHVNFADPTLLDLTTPASFGVITKQLVPANREISGARWIQFGLRVEF